jgi:negative regulator of flagellin synthesis FlgM
MTTTNGIGSSPLAGNLIDKTDRSTATEKSGKLAENATKTAGATTSGTTLDAASLSGAGSLLAAAATTDDVRTEKVEALKAAINNGTYNVPASDVADKLIRNMLE